jgi:hypothetical protein
MLSNENDDAFALVIVVIYTKANTINIIITIDMEKNNGIANIGLFILKAALTALFICPAI